MAIDHAYSADTIPASATALYTIIIVKLHLPCCLALMSCMHSQTAMQTIITFGYVMFIHDPDVT